MFERYLLGSSYYPEQWPPHEWATDFAKMRQLGFNVVRMGEFAWAFFEPAQRTYRFDWMDRAIAMAADHGIQTILCTPTAAMPAWLRQAHPDVLGANEKGPFRFGARKGYCTNSESLLAACDGVVSAMAEHYADNPHVIAWQLDNEPGYPFVCCDDNCLRAFQRFLKRKYETLDALNDAWGNAFWSHMYSDWSQIEFPINVGDGDWNPAHKLDYRRFFAESFFQYLQRQVHILRPRLGNRFIFTNWPGPVWSVDIYRAGRELLDATAWDNYQQAPGITAPHIQLGSSCYHDISRCAGPRQRFLVAEQNTQLPPHARREGLKLQTYLDVAHGSFGTIFFEWRPPAGGYEQTLLSCLNHDGSFTPFAEQFRQLGKELAELGPCLKDAVTRADVAILHCFDNTWHRNFWSGSDGYDAHLGRVYQGVKVMRRNVDVVPPDAPLSQYRVIIAPTLQIVTDEQAAHLREAVEAGAILVIGPKTGVRDVHNRIRPSMPPGPFAEIAGVRVVGSIAKAGLSGQILDASKTCGEFGICFDERQRFAPASVMEQLELRGATPLAAYLGGRMTGQAAVTVHRFGKGHVVYVATDSYDLGFYATLFRRLASQFDIEPLLDVPDDVEVVTRETETHRYYFVLNLSDEPRAIRLPEPMRAVLPAVISGDTVTLDPVGVAILETRK